MTRVAIVSGGAGGVGRAVGAALVADGDAVVLGDLDPAACEAVAKEVNAGPGAAGRAAPCRLDVTDPDSWARAVTFARRTFGYPTLLVNNAGVEALPELEKVTETEWAEVLDVCQRGVWLGIRALLPVMQAAGGGAVVNVGSIFGLVGSPGAFAYHAAKGAVRAMTSAAAVALAPRGIRVNAVHPGLVDTPMLDRLPAGFVAGMLADTPIGRAATPAEIAAVVRFLLSPHASYVTGAQLVVDGGYTAR